MADQKLLNVYLAVGEDALKRGRVIERLKKRLEDYGDISFNSEVFDAATALGDAMVAACNTLPFASEYRLVEVRNIEHGRKADLDALADYLASPCETTILALSGEKLLKTTKLYKAVAKFGQTAIIDCAPMRRADLVRSVRSMAVSHGFSMTPGACEKLVELVGQDTVRIDTELKKLAVAHNGNDPVTDSEVAALVAQTAEAKPWDLVDAFAARNVARCFKLLPLLTSTSPFSLMAQCQTRIRELMCANALDKQGRANDLAAVLKLAPWRVKNHLRWAHGFTEAELMQALVLSRDAEQKMKSGGDPWREFTDWFCVVAKRR